MKSKWKIMMFGAFIMLMVSGCSLAKEEVAEDKKDKLVGALITTEPLDLYDMEAFIEDNASEIVSGKSELGYDSDYEQKLYAVADKKGSEKASEWEISFQNVDGMLLMAPTWLEDGEPVVGAVSDDGISDLHTEFHVTDEADMLKLTASVYVTPKSEEVNMCLCLNPVYQTPNDEFYVVSGQCSSSSGMMGDGGTLTQRIEDKVTITLNGEETVEGMEVTVSMTCHYAPTKVTILQMNAQNEVIKREEYLPEHVPEEMKAEDGAAYFIVETECTDMNGNVSQEREIFEYDEEGNVSLESYYVLRGEFLARRSTEVHGYQK